MSETPPRRGIFQAIGERFGKAVSSYFLGPSASSQTVGPSGFVGSDGVVSYGGWIVNDEANKDLSTPIAKFTAYGNAINDSTTIAAAVRYILALEASTKWTADPGKDSSADMKKAVEIVEDGIFDAKTSQPWETTVGQMALSPLYGFSLEEWIPRRRADGLIVLGDIQQLPQWTIQRWDKGYDGTLPLQGVEQWVPGMPSTAGPKYISRDRLIHVADRKMTNRPDGIGLMRHVYKKWKALERIELLELFGFEGDLRGIPYARVPYSKLKEYAATNPNKLNGMTAANWVKAQTQIVRKFIEDHVKTPGMGVMIDSQNYTNADGITPSTVPMWTLEIMKGDGGGLEEIAKTIDRMNREIARVFGCDFMLLGLDGKGSYALSKDKTSMFGSLIQATLSQMAWSVTYDLAWPLLIRNGIDPEQHCPTILPDPIADEDIENITHALLDLAQAGAPIQPGDPVVDQVRQRMHLSEQPKIAPELMLAQQRMKVGLDPLTGGARPPPIMPGMPGVATKPNAPQQPASTTAAPNPTQPSAPVNSDKPEPK